MTDEESNVLIENNANIPKTVAAKLYKRTGIDFDDLHSAANEFFVRSARSFDPEKWPTGVEGFRTYAYKRVTQYMCSFLRRQRSNKTMSMDYAEDDTQSLHHIVVDKKQHTPVEIIEAKETIGQRLTEVSVRAPKETGQWVARLRAAAFDAISEGDVTDMMRAVMKKAKAGNLGAVQLVLDYMCGGRGSAVNQTVIVQNNNE